MSSENPTPRVTPKSALDTLKEWKELIAFVAVILTSVLNGVFGSNHPTLQKASWIFAVLFVAVGAYVIHRKQKRKQEKERHEKLWAEREALRKPQSAFRSLAPFEERDELPGRDRKIEARSIATRIASGSFGFGVVCGDSGCGKTSLLRSEVTRTLRGMGFEVGYIQNPRQLESESSATLPAPERLTRELRALLRQVEPTTQILILDQFEEWFIEYQDPELRKQLGQLISKLARRSNPVRVVCAIRRDFLIDFHDVAGELPQPLSTTNLFHVKNFTVEQAMNVITDCASAEGIALDDSFAETVAQDLADRDQVRPPELQIVCTYLSRAGGLSTPKYQQAGGTAGVLANYIQEALDASRDRALASKMLRALCDFPAHAKRKAKTIDELTAEVGVEGVTTKLLFEDLARNFVSARIIAQEQRSSGAAFSLIHDYLVGAIQLATSDDSTKTEEANQLLRFYVAEGRGEIPLRKLHFIRQFAEKRELERPAARSVLRRSLIAPFLRWGLPAALVLVVGGLYLLLTTQVHWSNGEIVGRHPRDHNSEDFTVEARTTPGVVSTQTAKLLQIWNARSVVLLRTINNPGEADPTWSRSGRFCLLVNRDRTPSRLIDLSTMSDTQLTGRMSAPSFDESEEWIHWTEMKTPNDWSEILYSIKKATVVEQVHNGNLIYAPKLDRLVTLQSDKTEPSVRVRALSANQSVATLDSRLGPNPFAIAVNETNSEICVLSDTTEKLRITLWDLRSGDFLDSYEVSRPEGMLSARVEFVSDGSHVVVFPQEFGIPIAQAIDAILITAVSNRKFESPQYYTTHWFRKAFSDRPFYFWSENDGISILDAASVDPQTVKDLRVPDDGELLISDDGKRAVAHDKQNIELWDLSAHRLLSRLHASGIVVAVNFTKDGSAVKVVEEGDVFSLFDAVDGTPVVTRFPSGGARVLYYDRNCRWFNVWDESGNVLRFTEGRSYFGLFRPSYLGWFGLSDGNCA